MSRRTLIYLGILALLGVMTIVRSGAPEGPPPIAFTIPAMEAEAITQVTLSWGEESVTLLRSEPGEGGTFLVKGLDYPADPNTLDGLLGLFEDPAPMDLKISDKPEDQAAYELTKAQALKMEVFGAGGTPEIALYIGKNGPMGTQFIRPVGSSQIYRAKVGSVGRFKKTPEDWRDGRVLFVEADDIRSIDLQGPKGALGFEKKGDEWRATEPKGLKVDQALIGSMARSLGALRSAKVLSELPPGAGFGDPYLRVTVGVEGEAPLILTVGDEAEANQRYAKRSGDNQGFLVRTGSLNPLNKSADEVRNKSLLSFEPAALEALSLQEGPRRVRVAAGEKEGTWTVLEPANAAIFPQTMTPVVTALSRLRVATFPGDADPEALGLGEGGFVIDVTLRGGEVHQLKVGDEAAGGQYYAQVDGGEVVTIYGASVKSLRQLLPAS